MAHNPIDRIDLPGDFSPLPFSSQGPTPQCDRSQDPALSAGGMSLHMGDMFGTPSMGGGTALATPAIGADSLPTHDCSGMRTSPQLKIAALEGPPTRRSLVFTAGPVEETGSAMHVASGCGPTPARAGHARCDGEAGTSRTVGGLEGPASVRSRLASPVKDEGAGPYTGDEELRPLSGRSGAQKPLFMQSQTDSRFESRGDSPPMSVRHPGTPGVGLKEATPIANEGTAHTSAGSSGRSHGKRSADAQASTGPGLLGVSGPENNAREVQRMASPRLGVQALTPAGCGDGDGVVRGPVSPHRNGGAGAGESSIDCNVHVKTVSNSSTGKSSGVSSLDGLERIVPRQESAGDLMKLRKIERDEDGQNDAGQRQDVDGSFVGIRRKLHSLVDDVFSMRV
jgi:hypothetical protein